MVMIQVFHEALVPMPEGSQMIGSMDTVDTPDLGFAAYMVGMNHARYYEEPEVPLAPSNVTPPKLSATTAVPDDVIMCDPGEWDNAPSSVLTMQWKADGTDVSGSGPSYTVLPGDVGKTLTCEVTCTTDDGSGKALSDSCLVS